VKADGVATRACFPETLSSPWGVGLVVLAIASATEYAIMLTLPELLYGEPPRPLESIVDALVLSVVLSPVLWWTVVRPLRLAATHRARYLSNLFAAIEEERRHIACDLHDGVGQSLTMVISGLRSLSETVGRQEVSRRILGLKETAEMGLTEVKRLSLGLRPSLLDDLGLAPAIERLAVDVQTHHGVEVRVEDDAIQGIRFPAAVETALFRICQEALTNVVKHASARRAEVRLFREPEAILLEIVDDGCGIDADRLHRKALDGSHMGIVGMCERATLLGGELSVVGEPGEGTRITARIPLESAGQ
jgi:signal transduction histidine kinase